MGYEHAALASCPGEDRRVVSATQSDVLHADRVQRGVAKPQPSEDLVPQVLVRDESQHPLAFGSFAYALDQLLAEAVLRKTAHVLRPHPPGELRLLL